MKRLFAAIAVALLSGIVALIAPTSASAACDYTDADQNGGWGWDAATGRSCPPRAGEPETPAGEPESPAGDSVGGIAAPSAVRASTVRGGIGLSWSPVPEAIGYNVYRNGNYVETVTGTWFRDDAAPGTTNTYYVVSFNSGGESYSTPSTEVEGRALASAVISIGDSFIAGEAGYHIGNRNSINRPNAYEPGTNTSTNLCHRSDVAPIRSAKIPNVATFNVACSGATSTELLSTGRYTETNQISQLRAIGARHHLDMIVISIGGNDMGFPELVRECVGYYFRSGSCSAKRRAVTNDKVANVMASAVERTIRQVQAEVAALNQHETRIVLQSYPSPIGASPRWSDPGSKISHGCPFHGRDMRWVDNELVPLIDQTYQKVASDLGVEFLSLSDAFDGKQVCSRGVTAGKHTTDYAKLEWTRYIPRHVTRDRSINEAMHPSYLGQLAMGRCLRMVWDKPNRDYYKCYNNGGLPSDMRMEYR